MDIAVIGCGAMGSIYAALLASSGHTVLAVDANEAHVQAINERGLRVWGASGDRTVQIRAHTKAPQGTVDLIVISVKARHVASAAQSARALSGPDTIVLTIQNGLGSAARVADVCGRERLLVGVAQGFGASLPEPGQAHHNDMKAIRIGVFNDESLLTPDAVEGICQLWRDAGFDTAAASNIDTILWEKLICNVAYSAPCAITGLTVGQVKDSAEVGPVSLAAAREAFAVAVALHVPLDIEDVDAHVQAFAARMPDARPSVLLDLEAGRISEVGVINGAVVEQAARLGMPAPVNAALTGLVQALEQRNAG